MAWKPSLVIVHFYFIRHSHTKKKEIEERFIVGMKVKIRPLVRFPEI